MPELSICVPTYNRVDLLEETLPTILNQTYSDFELVIVDNASTDGTEAFVRGQKDSRIRYVRNPENVGLVANQQRCVDEAKSSIVAVYHDHDLYDLDIVRQSMDLLAEHPRVGVVCTGMILVDPNNPAKVVRPFIENWDRVTPGKQINEILLHAYPSPITSPTAMVRKACYEQVGPWRFDVGEGADRELWLRIFRHWDLGYIKGPLARLRDRPARAEYTFAQAKHLWKTIELQHYISSIHVEQIYKDRPLRLRWERMRAKAILYQECWRWGIWAVAKPHPVVSEVGVDAFRFLDMPYAAGILRRMRQSRLAHLSMAQALRVYRTLFV